MDSMLWGGDYYIQVIDDINAYKYQYGTGCLADQVFGQMLAHLNHLGYVLPEEHIKRPFTLYSSTISRRRWRIMSMSSVPMR